MFETAPLVHAGLSEAEAANKAARFQAADEALDRLGTDRRERWSLWVPGRIEVLGKHTDYAGGRSLVCALERGLAVRVAARRDNLVRVRSLDRLSTFETSLTVTASGEPGAWNQYVATVVRRVALNFSDVTRGADIVLSGDLPADAGMSSSSALVVAVFIALSKSNELRSHVTFRSTISSSEELAAYLGAVENGLAFRQLGAGVGVGTYGGNQDHTAILCSEPGQVARYSWDPLKRETLVPVPAGHVFALGASGVHAPKAGAAMAKYNKVSLAARKLLELWNQDSGRADTSLGAALAVPEAGERLIALSGRPSVDHFAPGYLRGRLAQFVAETFDIIPVATDALTRGDLAEFGSVVDQSQELAERNLENQVPETVTLQRSARELGAVAASAFGAGFGGSVWALVPEPDGDRFLRAWKSRYEERHPGPAREAAFFLSRAGPHAYQF
ncbi:MAG: galactokinase [Gemmatimonadaceae bacterium]|nr:galactokinase [Gemmatimonadaceae bacterium]